MNTIRNAIDLNRLFDSSQSRYDTFTVPQLPDGYKDAIIAPVWVSEKGRYIYLAGRIEKITTDTFGRKVAKVRFFAPITKPVRLILWNNIITVSAFVEINYAGELYPVEIINIDEDTMEVVDEWGLSTWVKTAKITQVLSHQDLAGTWYQNYMMTMEMAS